MREANEARFRWKLAYFLARSIFFVFVHLFLSLMARAEDLDRWPRRDSRREFCISSRGESLEAAGNNHSVSSCRIAIASTAVGDPVNRCNPQVDCVSPKFCVSADIALPER